MRILYTIAGMEGTDEVSSFGGKKSASIEGSYTHTNLGSVFKRFRGEWMKIGALQDRAGDESTTGRHLGEGIQKSKGGKNCDRCC